jgi:hypothetical protein
MFLGGVSVAVAATCRRPAKQIHRKTDAEADRAGLNEGCDTAYG